MEETYSFSAHGYMFHAWPDGGALVDQEQCVVDLLKCAVSEKLKMMSGGYTR